jgi:SAM-dependent methyltransferase
VDAIRDWGARLPADDTPIVVDLGSGTGVALERARRWLAPRHILAYAVDQDADLLTGILRPSDGSQMTPIVGDVLAPLDGQGGPPDGTVDLVVSHAVADLLPLDRLAARVAALLRPGGLAHLALVYDGLTAFEPAAEPDLDAPILDAFHRHMDRPRKRMPQYGGSTAGRRLGPALAAAGLEILIDAPSVWNVRATDGPGGQAVLLGLLDFVRAANRRAPQIRTPHQVNWYVSRRAALDRGMLSARVVHRDLLVRRAAN